MKPDRKGELWTDAENTKLLAAGDKGEQWGEIGLRLNRTGTACKVQYNTLKRRERGEAKHVSVQRIRRLEATALAKEIRETRPQHRSITAEFFGDPLPGRSALDQRRVEVSRVTLAMEPMR
jgi:hypothetical protein